MAGIYDRNGIWYALWNQAGKKIRRNTGIKVQPVGMTPRQAKIKAQQQANIMEQAAKGITAADKRIDSINYEVCRQFIPTAIPRAPCASNNGNFTGNAIGSLLRPS